MFGFFSLALFPCPADVYAALGYAPDPQTITTSTHGTLHSTRKSRAINASTSHHARYQTLIRLMQIRELAGTPHAGADRIATRMMAKTVFIDQSWKS